MHATGFLSRYPGTTSALGWGVGGLFPPGKGAGQEARTRTRRKKTLLLTPKHPRRRAASTARAGARYRKKQTTVPTAGTTVFRMRSREEAMTGDGERESAASGRAGAEKMSALFWSLSHALSLSLSLSPSLSPLSPPLPLRPSWQPRRRRRRQAQVRRGRQVGPAAPPPAASPPSSSCSTRRRGQRPRGVGPGEAHGRQGANGPDDVIKLK
jgi:hypothetical protein